MGSEQPGSPGDELALPIREESQFSQSKEVIQEEETYSIKGSEALESRMYG